MALHFEDIEVGLTRDCGSLTVTEPEIVAFGERYDPQPFHTDPDAATESAYGGLIASGGRRARSPPGCSSRTT